ncbi:mechanosensitive ion channel family protein [Hydrogenophaga sp. NFH-34]|uniref:mechanosensitive ion channel family protein n=1 Tax=Hydrogenophaga sp. NFH-34 TaxID=2744446 RepID=UPI001F2038B6|nr:mechanosensitive ion channel family protein [Hydrogenophaga sp. NFH-34]
MKNLLPDWAHPWIDVITLGLQIALIVFAALLLRALLNRFINRLGADKHLPLEMVVGSRRLSSVLIFGAALLLVLDRLGVSGMVLWTAFTGFAAVAAVAFFAAWSVLSNIFCALLIYTTRPFGLHDHVELLESGDKPGLGGEVMDINLIYTTLKELPPEGGEPSWLRVPNSLFFQRMMRLRTKEPVVRSLLD